LLKLYGSLAVCVFARFAIFKFATSIQI